MTGTNEPTSLRVPAESLDFDDEQIFHYQGVPFTGVAYEDEPDGGRSEVAYVNGLQEGVERFWYPSGTLRSEGQFRRGAGHGYRREFRPDGTLEREMLVEHGIRVRVATFDDSGHETSTVELDESEPNYRVLQALRQHHDR